MSVLRIGAILVGLALGPLSAVFPGPCQENPAAPARATVRVFDGGAFVAGLGRADFEVAVDGRACGLTSLRLFAGAAVERSEGVPADPAAAARRFTLMFQLFEYHPKLAEAVRDFLERELRDGDALEIQTPVRNYILNPKALASQPRRALAERMIEIVRTDINAGSAAYNSLLTELKKMVRSIGGANAMAALETDTETDAFGVEVLLPRYRAILQNMDALRRIDIAAFERFARALKTRPGRKTVFYFYQREFRPEIDPKVVNELFSLNQDKGNVLGDLQELFQTYSEGFATDNRRLSRAFADSGAVFNLIFLDRKPDPIARIVMREQSEDVFRTLADIAQATGGAVNTSQNPAAGVEAVLREQDHAYLLEFECPPAATGAYRSLSVRIKGRDLKILHADGFFD